MPKEAGHFAKLTPARSPHIIYNSDTVYSTTTFRPVSPSPITPPAPNTPSPQRTRKLETPLHFDGGLFSDIRSTEGKLLSKVTVDRVQSSTQHDITDSPNTVHVQDSNNYVDDIVKQETITNKDVITVKFTPVPPELDSPWLLTPSQFVQIKTQSPSEYIKEHHEYLQSPAGDFMKEASHDVNAVKYSPVPSVLDSPRLLTPSQFLKQPSQSPVEYIKDNYEDLQSYKIVNSLCKEKLFESSILTSHVNNSEKIDFVKEHVHSDVENYIDENTSNNFIERLSVIDGPVIRGHSPLANIFVSEQLTKLDNYLQESLDTCLGRKGSPTQVKETGGVTNLTESQPLEGKSGLFETSTNVVIKNDTELQSYHKDETISKEPEPVQKKFVQREERNGVEINAKHVSKLNSAPKRKTGILNSIYQMPVHYHAAILCFVLIIYNLVYQYIKQSSQVNKIK